MSIDLDAIRARANAATPGPWGWFGNTDVHEMHLATKKFGRLLIMDIRRWGMQSARPRFAEGRTWTPTPQEHLDFPTAGLMVDGDKRARYEVAPDATSRDDERVYRADITGIRNPDAEFIAHARQDIDDLLAEVDRLRNELDQHRGALTATAGG